MSIQQGASRPTPDARLYELGDRELLPVEMEKASTSPSVEPFSPHALSQPGGFGRGGVIEPCFSADVGALSRLGLEGDKPIPLRYIRRLIAAHKGRPSCRS